MYKLCNLHDMSTFKTNVQLIKQILLWNELQIQHYLVLLQQYLITRLVTKATPISYIKRKCHINKLKSNRTHLIGYWGFISSELFSIAWGADTYTNTHTHTCIDFPDKSNFKKPATKKWDAVFFMSIPTIKYYHT